MYHYQQSLCLEKNLCNYSYCRQSVEENLMLYRNTAQYPIEFGQYFI